MNISKYILFCFIFGFTGAAWAKVEATQTQVAGNSKIQCVGALSDVMGKRYDSFDAGGSDKTNPSDAAMARYVRICRNAYKPIAYLEKRLKDGGILHPQDVLQRAARADDPTPIIRASVGHATPAELQKWRAAFASLRELSTAGPKLETAELQETDSSH